MSKQKLELMWVGKEKRAKLEPRILIEDPEKSYHAAKRVSDNDIFDNMLIHGDNLLALKALEQDYAGRVKCIYIDPPYNTGNAFEHYDDGLEHSIWLSLMRERLELLRNLLRKDGFICVHIDDSEGAYLKVLLDEVFGRDNYLTTIYIQVRYPSKTLKQDMVFHKEIEQIHVYRKEYGAIPVLDKKKNSFDKFNFYIKEKSQGKEIILGKKKTIIFQPKEYEIIKGIASENGLKEIWASGTILDGNSSGRFFRDFISGRYKEDGLGVLYKVYGIGDDKFSFRYFTGPKKEGATKGKYYQGVPLTQLDSDAEDSTVPIENFFDMAGSFGNCRLEGYADFRGGKKPEVLLEKVLYHFSNPGDLVLDSFLGSGTTAAVAHKMGRKWIGIELGEHCDTHCVPRLKKVIDGEDAGGITKSANWRGGGGFRYYNLAPSLVKFDEWGNPVINKDFNENMLVRALCKVEGFNFDPSPDVYWKQGKSTESDFIYVTTQHLTAQMLQKLSDDVGDSCTLLICCGSFDGKKDSYSNLTIKKIPKAILKKCEWNHDDYSLEIKNLPMSAPDPQPSPAPRKKSFKKLPPDSNQLDLF